MLKRPIVAVLAAGIVAVGEVPTVDAQQAPKQDSLATVAARSQLKDAIARMTDLKSDEIEIHTTNSIIRVLLVNTPYNSDRASDREYLASTIAALLAQKAKNDSAFERVVTFHIEFLKRGAWLTKTVDIMEFRKGQDGEFTQHRT